MKKNWFQTTLQIGFVAALIVMFMLLPARVSVLAQAAVTDTPIPGGAAPSVTNTYTEPVHVRAGPSSLYAQLGDLAVGETVQALGVSPQHEWIQIAFPSSPDGVGWVYAPFVTLSPGFLRVVEPPPTATPLATATIDPTLAAAFNIQPTETRLPTFTPPPPLVVPTFSDSTVSSAGFPMGMTIIAVAMIGALVLVVSFFGRH